MRQKLVLFNLKEVKKKKQIILFSTFECKISNTHQLELIYSGSACIVLILVPLLKLYRKCHENQNK